LVPQQAYSSSISSHIKITVQQDIMQKGPLFNSIMPKMAVFDPPC